MKIKALVLPFKISIISMSFFIACSTGRVISPGGDSVSLQELLQIVPAGNSTQTHLIDQALLKQGSAGIHSLCLLLAGNDKTSAVRAEYALNSLAFHITRAGTTEARKNFLQGIYLALESDQLHHGKPLLISLLKIAGDESSVKPLVKLLTDESLGTLVAPTMQRIGTPAAGKALLSALPRTTGINRAAIIQALGQMNFAPAAGKIFEYCGDPDSTICIAAIAALVEMGYPPLQPVLIKWIAENGAPRREWAVEYYLQFIHHLDDKVPAVQYCREIINNSPAYYSAHNRLTALNILVDLLGGTPALPDVLSFMENGSAKDQLLILPLLEKMDSGTIIRTKAEKKNELPSCWRAGFIAMLGTKKDLPAVPFIKSALQDPAAEVQAAAIAAIIRIVPEDAVSCLLPLLQQNTDSTIQVARWDDLFNGLCTVPSQDLFPALVEHYSGMNLNGKRLVLSLLAARRIVTNADFIIGELNTDQAGLRTAVIQKLPDLVTAAELPRLFSRLGKMPTGEQEMLLKSILIIISRTPDDPEIYRALIEFARQVDDSDRAFLFPMLKQAGNDAALQILRTEIKSLRPEQKDLAWRTLCEWPCINALTDLIELVSGRADLTYRVLATRACLRLLEENDLGKEIEFQNYRTLYESAPRIEEKKSILTTMAELKSEKVLRYLTLLIDQTDIGSTATMAIINMIRTGSDSTAGIKETEITRAFLLARLKPGSAAEKILLESEDSRRIFESQDSLYNQAPSGFTALFNGKDLSGWQGLVTDPPGRAVMSADELRTAQQRADPNMNRHWKVVDGILCFDGRGENLCTVKNYTNFELRLDWKIEKKGDSGIYLRGSPQVQIWDPGTSGSGSGGLYNNQQGPSQALQVADRAVGEWNTFHIVMIGPRVTVYLNEQLVVDNVVLENYWERNKAIYTSGPIELQAHYNPLYFRNIFIRELPEEEMPYSENLFNGKDLTGWHIIDGLPGSWQVQDSLLFTTGQEGGWISTDRTFADFKLELEFRLPAGGNSGIFIRAPHKGDPAYTGVEIQLLDDYAEQYGNLKPWQYTGSIYGIQPPAQRVSKSANTWQKILIICRGPQIEVILNNVLIIDTNLIDHMDQEATHPGIKRRSGFIGLQNHSSRVEFKNISLIGYD